MRGFKSKPYYIFVSDDRVLIAGVLALDDLKTPEREGKNLGAASEAGKKERMTQKRGQLERKEGGPVSA